MSITGELSRVIDGVEPIRIPTDGAIMAYLFVYDDLTGLWHRARAGVELPVGARVSAQIPGWGWCPISIEHPTDGAAPDAINPLAAIFPDMRNGA